MSNPLRNSNINYSDGWFFVTMQVAQNKTMFGVIADDKCELNALGEKVGSSWEGMFARHPEAYRDASVVMPNHFHAVIRIHRRPTNKPNHLSYLIQGFKSFTTHLYHAAVRAGQCPDIGTSLWMSSYYDNLITSRRELENIRAYVRDNPARWDNDRFGPVTTYHCGNLELLHEALVAYVASEGPDTEVRPHDTDTRYRKAGPPCPVPPCPVLISTFTSPQERGVLARCLAVRRPFIHVMPGGIPERLPPAVARACAEGWALVLSPSAPGTGINKQRAIWCNRYVLDRAARITHGYIRPGGTLETLLRTIVAPVLRVRGGQRRNNHEKTYVSFLGTGNYKPCVYYLEPDDPAQSASDSGVVTYVQTAMRKLVACGAEKTLIFCTRDAAETHWQKLCAEFDTHGLPEPEKVGIPGGSSDKEFWEIFKTVNKQISKEAEIVFDVTHSFRSLPLIMSVLLNYLEVVKGTKLVGCYYGAFETLGKAADVEKKYPDPADRRAPIVDLTPFFQLNDWVKAIRDFKRFGDAGDLNRLAKQDTKSLAAKEETRTREIEALRSLTGALNKFTQMVHSSRCKDIQDFNFESNILNQLEPAAQCDVLPQLEPVLAGLRDVFAAYQDKDLKNGIRAARWAYEHDLIPQGYTLLQETIVSHYAQEFSADLERLYPKREDEVKRREYTSALLAWRTGPWKNDDSELAGKLKSQIDPEVEKHYDTLTQGRNDINHGGHSHNARKAEKLKKDIGDAITKFEALLC